MDWIIIVWKLEKIIVSEQKRGNFYLNKQQSWCVSS